MILALSQRPQKIQKEPANKYFSFSGGFALAQTVDDTDEAILIKELQFNITALGGKATNVQIFPLQGVVPREEIPQFDVINRGETVTVGPIIYPYKVLSTKEAQGYPVYFKVICNEAEGEVTIYVTEFITR